ncbi:hypothetical protein RvY_08311 [Ramazzottius varieornatus]|uniref:Uncharacterized protein n=1 Tax=Ramazzottius varieornatus TaxID=947166 RepID=A0A1D1V841_RAMVA|nr:hypothetical protein RvY_08311 [Ramazzottius varieornatus]
MGRTVPDMDALRRYIKKGQKRFFFIGPNAPTFEEIALDIDQALLAEKWNLDKYYVHDGQKWMSTRDFVIVENGRIWTKTGIVLSIARTGKSESEADSNSDELETSEEPATTVASTPDGIRSPKFTLAEKKTIVDDTLGKKKVGCLVKLWLTMNEEWFEGGSIKD